MWWYAVIGIVIFILLVGWIANSARLARRNKNLAHRSPKVTGDDKVDEQNRPTNQAVADPHVSREPQPRPAAPELDPYYESPEPPRPEAQQQPAAQPGPEHRP